MFLGYCFFFKNIVRPSYDDESSTFEGSVKEDEIRNIECHFIRSIIHLAKLTRFTFLVVLRLGQAHENKEARSLRCRFSSELLQLDQTPVFIPALEEYKGNWNSIRCKAVPCEG